MTARFSKIQWGDGLTVTPDADDPTIIRVDAGSGGGGGGGGGSISTGSGSPLGVVTPAAAGELYIDTAAGALYIATGLYDVDWRAVGGNADYNAIGVSTQGGSGTLTGNQNAVLTDVNAAAGSGNGLYWHAQLEEDGTQELQILLGPEAAFEHVWDAGGGYKSAAGIAAFGHSPPSSQPATPSTLADVIAILQGAGLCA